MTHTADVKLTAEVLDCVNMLKQQHTIQDQKEIYKIIQAKNNLESINGIFDGEKNPEILQNNDQPNALSKLIISMMIYWINLSIVLKMVNPVLLQKTTLLAFCQTKME